MPGGGAMGGARRADESADVDPAGEPTRGAVTEVVERHEQPRADAAMRALDPASTGSRLVRITYASTSGRGRPSGGTVGGPAACA